MKRDWDLIRQQLTDIEEDRNPLAELTNEPLKFDQQEDDFQLELDNYNQLRNKIFGHLQLLSKAEYIEGIIFVEYLDGATECLLNDPKLTMKGYDLLDTMRSKGVWERVKTTAKSKGIELTFDAVKQLSAVAIKNMLE